MSYQNNIAKESLSLQNHIVRPCFNIVTQTFSSCITPMRSQAIISYFWCTQTFSIFTQYMTVSHGHSTMGVIEYDEGGCVRRQITRKSHIDAANQRAMEMPIN